MTISRYLFIIITLVIMAFLPAVMLAEPSSSQSISQLANATTNKIKGQISLWKDTPEWLKRTEFGVGWNSENQMEYRFLTTQPLFQAPDKEDTIFIQGGYQNYDLYNIRRNTVNIGLGYRKLLLDNALMLGGNIFGDYEFNYSHRRWSIGVEAKYGVLDLNINRYIGLGASTVKGARERVMSGYDTELGTQLPYLPWTKIYGRFFLWEKEIGRSNTIGSEFSADLNLLPYLTFVTGTRNDNRNKRENYALLQFKINDEGTPTLSTQPVSNVIWNTRDLRNETLTKVRRENRIITERAVTTGGVTVVVKKG